MRLLLFSGLVLAAMNCNPNVDPTCTARNPALADWFLDPLTSPLSHFEASMESPQIQYTSEGAVLGIHKRLDNPQLTSKEYILFGKAEAEIRGSPGLGIISSLYLQSDDLDEIDITEMFGGTDLKFQTNYFVKGNVSNHERGSYHDTVTSPFDNFHKYGVEWTSKKITFFFDDKPVRSIYRKGNKHGYPLSPMRVIISMWAGGDYGNSKGTIEWAGGLTDYKKTPFYMTVRNVRIENYTGKVEYVYNGEMGMTCEEYDGCDMPLKKAKRGDAGRPQMSWWTVAGSLLANSV